MLSRLFTGMMRRGLSRITYRFAEAPHEALTGRYGIYLNVPFCPTRCVFCPFYAEPLHRYHDHGGMTDYVDAVVAEIEAVYSSARHTGEAEWLYVGGGTPNTLPVSLLRRMTDAVRAHVAVPAMGIELLPALATPDYLRELKEAGFSRISIGVQSASDEVVRRTGRTIQTSDHLAGLVQAARSIGLWVSLDLMIGLADQTADIFERDVQAVCALRPDQLTIYPLIHVRGVPLRFAPALTPDQQYRLIEQAADILNQAGYTRRTVWSYAQGEGDLYDLSGSEIGATYIGFGAGAYSVYGAWRVMNPEIAPYMQALREGRRMAFISRRHNRGEALRDLSRMIYNLRLRPLPHWPLGMRALAVTLVMAGYARNGNLTLRGRLMGHEMSRTVMEALPFAIQDPSSVENYAEYEEYRRRAQQALAAEPAVTTCSRSPQTVALPL